MTSFKAFTETDEPFSSIEEAVETLSRLPWMENRTVRAVLMVTQRDSNGVQGEVVSGVSHPEASDTAVYIVDVEHVVGGTTIEIRYMIEFGEVDSGEDTGHEGDAGDEPRDEEASEESDGSVEQGSEVNGDVPPTGTDPDTTD